MGGAARPVTGARLARLAARFAELAGESPADVLRAESVFAGMPASIAAIGEAFRLPLKTVEHLGGGHVLAPARALDIALWHEVAGNRGDDLLDGLFSHRWPVFDSLFLASADGGVLGHRCGAFTAVLDRRAMSLLGWLAPAGRLPAADQTRPLFRLLSVALSDSGRHVMHAGMVAAGQRGALVVGRGGAGKSTTVVSCACDGLAYLGDDAIALEESADGNFRGHSLFGSALLDLWMLRRFPKLAAVSRETDAANGDKRLVILAEAMPETLTAVAPVTAILLPRVSDQEDSTYLPASPGEAFRALAPSTLVRPFGPGAKTLPQLARLVARTPRYWLNLGRDVGDIPRCVREILANTETQP
jgi:hypothetical protein